MVGMDLAPSNLNPVSAPISFYNQGRPHWWLTAFLLAAGLGISLIARAVSLRSGWSAATTLLLAAAVALAAVAALPADSWFPWQRPLSTRGWLHVLAAMFAGLAFTAGSLAHTRAERRRGGADSLTLLLDALSLSFVGVVAFVAGVATVFLAFGRQPEFIGLGERAAIVLALAWCVVVSRRATAVSSPEA